VLKFYFKKRIFKSFYRLCLLILISGVVLSFLHSKKTTKEAEALKNESGLNSFIVKYKSDKKTSKRTAFKIDKKKSSKDLDIIDASNIKELEDLKQDEAIDYIQPNFKRKLFINPSDPYYNSTRTFGIDNQWNLKNINLNSLQSPPSNSSGWEVHTGSADTVVAVIDTGIDLNHPDLKNNVWENIDEVPGNNIDDDSNGYVDDIHGYNFAYSNNNPQDILGHGTHVSGVIAASTNNLDINNAPIGIAGICWTCKIMPLKVIYDDNYGFDSDIGAAIEYAVDNGAKVVNISLGGPGYSQFLQDAIDYAWDNNVLVISSAGNDAGDAANNYPGGSMHSLTISSIDYLNYISSFSNTGTRVDLTAPGSDILSTIPQNMTGSCVGSVAYDCYYGTSMAAPHITGVAALLYDLHKNDPSWDAPKIREVILKKTTDLGALDFDNLYGFGKPDAYRALTAPIPTNDITSPISILNATDTGFKQGSIAIKGTANDANLYIYTLNIARNTDGYIQKQISGRSNISNNTLINFNTTTVDDGVYNLSLRVEDFAGNETVSDSIQITIDNDGPNPFYGTQPPSNSWVSDTSVIFSWDITGHPNDTNYDLYIDNTLRASDLITNSISINDLSEGNHSWYVIAKDDFGHGTQSNIIDFGIDRTAPNNFSFNPSVNGPNATFSFSTSDSLSGVSRYEKNIDNSGFVQTISPFSLSFDDGSHTVIIKAFDYANNVRTVTQQFLIDTTPPNEFTINIAVENSKITANFATNDNVSGVNRYEVSLDSGSFSQAISPFILENISDGSHTLTVKAYDLFGNNRTSTAIFKIDTRTTFLKTKGDFNGSGKVDLSDLSILAQNWKTNSPNGDANGDGKVDLTDLSILAQNWNKSF
jgi:subtilisin family serine protease